MCVYCKIGDIVWRNDPPWNPWKDTIPSIPDNIPWQPLPGPSPIPHLPKPVGDGPYLPWKIEKLKEYLEILKQVKELEDKIGCPCEPNKADYINLFETRISELENKT